MKCYTIGLMTLCLVGCKSAKNVASTPENLDSIPVAEKPVAPAETETELPKDNFASTYYATVSDFQTAVLRVSAKYEDEKQEQNISADIRIKKDETIWLSVKFLGIVMAKALITPEKVQYFEKIGGTYFEGDYTTLSQWLGTDLDFQRVQNLLIGQPMESLNTSRNAPFQDGSVTIYSEEINGLKKLYRFEELELRKTQVVQIAENRSLSVDYPAYAKNFPLQLLIEALHDNQKTSIRINYNQVSFNETVSFPYSVPSGYERIYIK